jgi:hypothetical protein
MRENTQGAFMAKSIQEWIHEGEELHSIAVGELGDLDKQLAELEQRRAAKLAEVNQIAGILGKPPAETVRRVAAFVADDRDPTTSDNASATIARALAGKGLHR